MKGGTENRGKEFGQEWAGTNEELRARWNDERQGKEQHRGRLGRDGTESRRGRGLGGNYLALASTPQ